MDQGGDGGGVAVVEAHGDGEDFIGGRGREGNAEFGAIWVGGNEGWSEDGREDEGGCGQRLPDGRKGVKGRHHDCSRFGLKLRLLKLVFRESEVVVQNNLWGCPRVLYSQPRIQPSSNRCWHERLEDKESIKGEGIAPEFDFFPYVSPSLADDLEMVS